MQQVHTVCCLHDGRVAVLGLGHGRKNGFASRPELAVFQGSIEVARHSMRGEEGPLFKIVPVGNSTVACFVGKHVYFFNLDVFSFSFSINLGEHAEDILQLPIYPRAQFQLDQVLIVGAHSVSLFYDGLRMNSRFRGAGYYAKIVDNVDDTVPGDKFVLAPGLNLYRLNRDLELIELELFFADAAGERIRVLQPFAACSCANAQIAFVTRHDEKDDQTEVNVWTCYKSENPEACTLRALLSFSALRDDLSIVALNEVGLVAVVTEKKICFVSML
jgi:hypothetical protein